LSATQATAESKRAELAAAASVVGRTQRENRLHLLNGPGAARLTAFSFAWNSANVWLVGNEVSGTIRLGWWNTSLAPRGKHCAAEQTDYDLAASVLAGLIRDENVDLIALGEVTPTDLANCCKHAKLKKLSQHLRFPAANQKQRRGNAVGVIFDPTKIAIVDEKLIQTSSASMTDISGWHLVVEERSSGNQLDVVVVHWPSRGRGEDAARIRRSMAQRLFQKFGRDRNVVILGDFNDEPFSQSMYEDLQALRERDVVRLRGAFYNPFWRMLGEQQHNEDDDPVQRSPPAGTHYFRSGTHTRWHTFDQIVVSATLLGSGLWRLVEGRTCVVASGELLQRKRTMRGRQNHLPVATSLAFYGEKDG
jgi:endonuclease/exonuclease/phosphatase family metal-dependent hydrolase